MPPLMAALLHNCVQKTTGAGIYYQHLFVPSFYNKSVYSVKTPVYIAK